MKTNAQNINNLLTAFKIDLQNLYNERLDKLILFGSYSRNEAQEHSDIDLLLVLNDKQILPYKEIDFTSDLVFDYMLNYEKQISIVPTTKQQFKQQESPLLLNIRKDGINL
jgi:predicted nucleotidyltransferase